MFSDHPMQRDHSRSRATTSGHATADFRAEICNGDQELSKSTLRRTMVKIPATRPFC